MNKKKFKGMKVPEEVYNQLKDLKVIMIQKGIKNLPFNTSGTKSVSMGTVLSLCIKAIKYLLENKV